MTKIALTLFALPPIPNRMKCILLCILLKDKSDMGESNLVIQKLLQVARQVGMTEDRLRNIEILMKQTFTFLNGSFLTYASLEPDSLVHVGPLVEATTENSVRLKEVTVFLNRFAETIYTQHAKLDTKLDLYCANMERRVTLLEHFLYSQNLRGNPETPGSSRVTLENGGTSQGNPETPGSCRVTLENGGTFQGTPGTPGSSQESIDSRFSTAFSNQYPKWQDLILIWHLYGVGLYVN